MRKRVIMHLRNRLLLFLLILAVILPLAAQTAAAPSPAPAQSAAQSTVQQPTSAPQQPANTQQQAPSGAPQQPATQQPGQGQGQAEQGQAPDSQQGDVFTFKKEVQNVILHATVVDDKQHLVMDLPKDAFTVYENGQPQRLIAFHHEDIPVALGIVIDNSGSMRDKRPKVNQAAINLVKASNPKDEVFVVNFNDEYYLDQDFTPRVDLLKDALDRIEARGGTALYDAVVASADHLKASRLDKKVLLVVTDGEDNASRESLEQAIRRLQADNGPTVYTIGLLGDEHARRAKRALEAIAEQTGGVSFFPKDLSQVDEITQEVAHDIRNQYTLVYKPTIPQSRGGYRTIKVEAHSKGHKNLSVRTRSGYYANTERASLQ